MLITKPMLAVAAELDKLKFPLIASPKYDGIRAIKPNGELLSRKFKPIPNTHVRSFLERFLPDGVDGELIIPGGTFNDCQSAFMSMQGTPNFEYHLFDYVDEDVSIPFSTRLVRLQETIDQLYETYPHLKGCVRVVEQKLILDMDELMTYEEKCVSEGYEGIMVRTLDGPYKCGRSTLREGYLLKIKRWVDAEGVILSVEEQMRNENEAKEDELGHSKRSSHLAGMVPANTLGEFVIRDISTGVELKVGTGEGLTKELRQQIWNSKDSYVGRIITYKYQPSGVKDKPRFPIWKGFRDANDMGGE